MRKLLIVEDDLIVANIYRNKLVVEGFSVEVATDGDVGWSLVQSFRPDLVLLDLIMPKVSGTELLRKLRSTAEYKNLPVIVFSNTYLTSMMQEAWKAGATKCLAKANCTPRQLIEVVESCLNDHPSSPPLADAPPSVNSENSDPNPAVFPSSLPSNNSDDGGSDHDLQENLRRNLLSSLPSALLAMRPVLHAIAKISNDPARLGAIEELHRQVRKVASAAGVSGLPRIARMASATEALLKELHERPKNLNASTLRTVTWAIDYLGVMAERGTSADSEAVFFANVLVVDDEPISRQAVCRALAKAGLNSISVDSAKFALYLLQENKFDLIFLDIDMPEMTGLELCAKLRAIPRHAKTPVVFVTGLNDFENRANSSISGGNDLIGKPFMPIELAVKALGYVMRGLLEKPKEPVRGASSAFLHA